MKKTLFFSVMAVLCLFFDVDAQDKSQIAELKIGDKFPDITISNVINYKDVDGNQSSIAKIEYFKGKIIILDFWATWCSSCISNFPKMDSLQRAFGKKLIVMGVAEEPTKEIKAFFERANNKNYTFPSSTGDTMLKRLFPHRSLPHYVWIGTDGYVKAITGPEDINASNIKTLLDIGEVHTGQKFDIDPDRPLFTNEQVVMDSLAHYAILYHNVYDGLVTTRRYREMKSSRRGVAITNQPLLSLYETAAEGLFGQIGQHYFPNRRLLASRDSLIMQKDASSLSGPHPNRQSLYNYDLIVPLKDTAKLYQHMLADLNQNTLYTGKVEKRKTRCLVLKKTSPSDKIKSKNAVRINTLYHQDKAVLQSAPLSVLIIWLNSGQLTGLPVLDETGYSGKVDLNLGRVPDLQSLQKALAKYDLSLTAEERLLDMFILSDTL